MAIRFLQNEKEVWNCTHHLQEIKFYENVRAELKGSGNLSNKKALLRSCRARRAKISPFQASTCKSLSNGRTLKKSFICKGFSGA